MIISKSNFASDATVTITPESPIQDVSVIVDGDYSSVYSDALQTSTTIKLDFGEPRTIEYLAIGGSNITTKDRVVISSETYEPLLDSNGSPITDSGGDPIEVLAIAPVEDADLGLTESRVIMYKLLTTELTSISITIFGSGQLKVAEVACGEIYTVPNGGEQSGYSRPWSVPNVMNRSATNLQNAPINLSYQSRVLKSTLTIDNLIRSNTADWEAMTDFCAYNTFYILEDDNKYHSYACFNMEVKPLTADARTREINKASLTFNAYARENEVIF
jgi:hypothetical protein